MRKKTCGKASGNSQKKYKNYTKIKDDGAKRYVEKGCEYPEGAAHNELMRAPHMYIDYGKGFSENNKITPPFSDHTERFVWSELLDKSVRRLHFDPVKGLYCIVLDLEIRINGRSFGAFEHNGDRLNNDIYFDSMDPQITVELPLGDTNRVEISAQIIAFGDPKLWSLIKQLPDYQRKSIKIEDDYTRLVGQFNELSQQFGAMEREVQNYKMLYQQTKSSISWMLTKPVRLVWRSIIKIPIWIRKFLSWLLACLRQTPRYYIDCCEYANNILAVKGWIVLEKSEKNQLQVVVNCGGHKHILDVLDRIRRPDVFDKIKTQEALHSGFKMFIRTEDCPAFTVGLSYRSAAKKGYIRLKAFHSEDRRDTQKSARITVINSNSPTVELKDWVSKNTMGQPEYPSDIYSQKIDVVVPVYNGYEYLMALFGSISNTKMQHRLIIVNDSSTDERVWPYIQKRFQNDLGVVLVNNEENIGFVKSVNKALGLSEGHVAIVNTDTEMPPMWLERLMAPIILNPDVASSTPFTNAGTICSFPHIGVNNTLFEGLGPDEIDAEFKKLRPSYCPLPTGVGFCMGMSREALNQVGLFDEATFSKGYGEENDWCQRAIGHGYKNVAVENLFVYHKHGGSFSSAEKSRLLAENQEKLSEKHPNYLKDVARFFEADLLRPMRQYVTMRLSFGLEKKSILVFDHNLGGGASSYLEKRISQWLLEEHPVVVIRYNPESQDFFFIFRFRDYEFSYMVNHLDDLKEVLMESGVDTIYINELVTYAKPYKVLDQIIALKIELRSRLVYLFHDYYALCPSFNLLNERQLYCNLPDADVCEACIKANKAVDSAEVVSRKKWTERWLRFLSACDDIVVFSQSSADLVSKVYGDGLHVSVQPHKVDHLITVNKRYKTTTAITIGLLGVLTYHKGAGIIRDMLNIIRRDGINAKIVLIGSTDGDSIGDPNFTETGAYSVEMLPKLVYQYDIDLFFISSIWPETFSYTAEEIMQSNLPVVAFDLGAPAERIRSYSKGRLVSKIDADMAVKEIRAFGNEVSVPLSPYVNERILFVTEFVTFSSRYRVEHLRERMIVEGVQSDFIEVKDIGKYNILGYTTFIIYRCAYSQEIEAVIKTARENRVRVLYDIDDYIFDYKQIKHLDFLKLDEYKDFEQYSAQLKKCMVLCDGFVTSTDSLKERIMSAFPDRPIFINRNVASMEMVILSQRAASLAQRDSEKVVLGYFSGSKTHDKDFLLIKDVLLELMDRHSHLYLVMGGVVEIDPQFSRFDERIITHGFMEWQRLPELIASVDINLMPLEDTVFHACKSENKWTEAALVKVPTVASHNSELAGAIEHGVTGYLCRTTDEWRAVLDKLIVSKAHCEQIGAAAYEKVMRHHTTQAAKPELLRYILKA